ncbi:DUF2637 domain-containing protein [Actinomadura sp. BRA 177]|uniref:DUF2637 domain-containing protein n=1 Tax=Actinomadura sp. BRA 177 TaxID=2745202 RepID=UPI0015960D1D|nr:DUF2637 domain-containing protein [Actinomadura sp. BRA 177]NVI91401.1 DUF2637 domain-containing protein [Actinomadura sp. BRA 177]
MTATPFHVSANLGAQATNPHAADHAAIPLRPLTSSNEVPTDPPASPPPSPGPAEGAEGGASQGRALTSNEFTAVAVVAALVAVLGLLGFVNSFAAVADAARPSFGRLAWSVPIGIDLGIAIFAALDIVLARLDMRVRWLRLVPWALTAATVYLNVAEQSTAFGRLAHAMLPALWVCAVEIAAHVIRIRAGIANGTRMDGIRPSRWILAPWPTLKLWRRMVLWEIRSYPDALARERARVLALTDLQDAYGRWAWRRRAPRRVRALYRLGDLAPADGGPAAEVTAVPSAGPVADRPGVAEVDRPALESGPSTLPTGGPSAGPSGTGKRTGAPKKVGGPGGRSARPSRKTGKAATPPPDVDDLMPLGWRIAADLAESGQPLTRNALAVRLRAAGQSAGNARVGALLARLKTEVPTYPTDVPTSAVPAIEGIAAAPSAEGENAS